MRRGRRFPSRSRELGLDKFFGFDEDFVRAGFSVTGDNQVHSAPGVDHFVRLFNYKNRPRPLYPFETS
jgi:hypothetical protein